MQKNSHEGLLKLDPWGEIARIPAARIRGYASGNDQKLELSKL